MAVHELFEFFFDLPSELREQILGYLLIRPEAIQIRPDAELTEPASWSADHQTLSWSSDSDEEDGAPWPLNYFLVCQTFKREATAMFFRENIFHVLSKGTKVQLHHPIYSRGDRARPNLLLPPKEPRSGDALLLNPAWTPSVRRIRNVIIHIQRLRGSLEQAVFQPLLDMILAGGLKNLEIRVGFRVRSDSMFSALPMRCMYRVLTDPDLLVARLCIPAEHHESAWCAFHQDGGEGREKCAFFQGMMEGPRTCWLDVDVAALIRKYGDVDDQFRIVKVGD